MFERHNYIETQMNRAEKKEKNLDYDGCPKIFIIFFRQLGYLIPRKHLPQHANVRILPVNSRK